LTRADSKSKLPEGVKVAQIDYNDESTLVSALEGHQVLIITLSIKAAPDTQSKLIQAAAKVGIRYVMPNAWGLDILNPDLTKSVMMEGINKACAQIEAAGMTYMTLTCGFWYEYSLVNGPVCFGFEIPSKKVTFYDDGKTKINVSTWDQCGRAIAALFSFKELPEDENDKSTTVNSWRNKPVTISSFLVSQKDMFESWKRVTGDKDEDWTIEYQPTSERHEEGKKRLQAGDRLGYGMLLYARNFYPDGTGAYESKYGLQNAVLGLPEEDLDERTKVAIQMVESGYSYFDRN